ncbi:hypothetical protein [Devosia nitrariae]|uniref:Uncharacterized protein n=1 Tax=Devosia nitrariae TaxID=2071872 RepID=A0ABQ5W5V4_9HYPH|nr:hypothetical protein [Devosia nitrariae]GLQ55267.1 hypothetical protein GCM10010862_25260 [Devosia nitrariae]
MKKVLMGLLAASMLSGAPIAISTSAYAAVVLGSDVCGELPNVKWSWIISSTTSTSGGDTSTTMGDVAYQGNGNVGKADVTTTTSAVIETTTNVCTAINPQGKVNADHSTVTATEVEIAPASSTTTNEVVCNKGSSLPTCPLS